MFFLLFQAGRNLKNCFQKIIDFCAREHHSGRLSVTVPTLFFGFLLFIKVLHLLKVYLKYY